MKIFSQRQREHCINQETNSWKKVLFIHMYFRTPEEGGGIRSYHMAKALVNQGHTVHLIAATNNTGKIKEIDGIHVHYLPVYYDNRLGFAGRTFAFIKFLVLATLRGLKIPNIDVCYISSSPLTVGVIGLVLLKLKNISYMFEVMDLWPEAPIQMGFLRNRFLKKIFYKLENYIYRNSALVVAAAPGMAEGVLKSYPAASVKTIPNVSDCNFFYPEEKKPVLIKKYNVENKFVCCYTGAIGLSNNLEIILEIAYRARATGYTYIHFLIAGEGASLPGLKRKVKEMKLENISFVGYLDKKGVKEIYNVSDCNLIFFAPPAVLETNSPNKFFDGLAAGLPTIVNKKGWIKELCEENECGKYFDSSPDSFLRIVDELSKDKNLCKRYSDNARKLAEREFDKDMWMEKYLDLFR